MCGGQGKSDGALRGWVNLLPGVHGPGPGTLGRVAQASGFADEFELSGRFQRLGVEGADFGHPADIQRQHQPLAGHRRRDDAGALGQGRDNVRRWRPRGFPRRGKDGTRRRSGPRPPPAPRSGPRSASSAAPAPSARPARGSVRAQRYRSCKALNKAHLGTRLLRIAVKGWRSPSAATRDRPASTACSRCSARNCRARG